MSHSIFEEIRGLPAFFCCGSGIDPHYCVSAKTFILLQIKLNTKCLKYKGFPVNYNSNLDGELEVPDKERNHFRYMSSRSCSDVDKLKST